MNGSNIRIFTYLFWIVFFLVVYISYSYKNTKNKHLFLKTGPYRALIWLIGILFIPPFVIDLVVPPNLVIFPYRYMELDTESLKQLFSSGNYFGIFYKHLSTLVYNTSILGLIPLLVILLTWFVYLRRLDFHEKDKIHYSIIVVTLGFFGFWFNLFVDDLLTLSNLISTNQTDLVGFVKSKVLLEGIFEELIKLAPVAVVILTTKTIDEPYDYILFASLSALGYSLGENFTSFASINGISVIGKALITTVSHFLFSSIAIYGLVEMKYRYRDKNPAHIILSLFLATIFHASFDFLSNHKIGFFLAYPMLILLLQYWTLIINNCLNNSSYFDDKSNYNTSALKTFLSISLSATLVLDYLFNYVQFGIEEANWGYQVSCLWGGLFILFYVTSFGNIDAFRGYWRPFKWKDDFDEDRNIFGDLFSSVKANHVISSNFLNFEIEIYPPSYNRILEDVMFTHTGMIVHRVALKNDPSKKNLDTNWFVVKLNEPIDILEHETKYVLIRLARVSLIHGQNIKTYLRLIPDIGLLKKRAKNKEDFTFGGYVVVNSIKIPRLESV